MAQSLGLLLCNWIIQSSLADDDSANTAGEIAPDLTELTGLLRFLITPTVRWASGNNRDSPDCR